jgi:glucose/arabinose dehydrogenase
MKYTLSILVCLFLFSNINAQAPQLDLEYFAYGLERPVDIAHPKGDSMLYVVQQTGKIRIVNPTTNSILPDVFLNLEGIAVQPDGNEQGLLGLAFHPEYATNGWFFVNYINIERKTIIQRFTRSADNYYKADSTSGAVVLAIPQPFGNHNGGCLRFGKDGMLYIGMGDGGFSNLPADPNGNAQNPTSLLGKMLRINVDALPYTIPSDNPFVNNLQYSPEVWASGLRNPWRFNFDSENGDLWIGDVGMQIFDEVDYHAFNAPSGQNFGWKCYEGSVPYNASSCPDTVITTPPAFEYANVGGFCGASVVGGVVYHGEKYPGMKDWYIFNDFCTGEFYGLKHDLNGQLQSANLGKFPLTYDYAAFGEGEDGEIYMVGYISQGLYRIKDKCLNANIATPIIENTGGEFPIVCLNPDTNLTYQWLKTGLPIVGANADTLGYDLGQVEGIFSLLVTNADGCQSLSEQIAIFLVGTEENKNNRDEITIYPNPTHSNITIQLTEKWQGNNKLTVFDLDGKIIEVIDFQQIGNEKKLINFGNSVSNGIYFLEILNENGQIGQKRLVIF